MDPINKILKNILKQISELKSLINNSEMNDDHRIILSDVISNLKKLEPTLSISDKIDIKLVLSDVDGVLTDAGMYYSENGDEIKKFHTHDGMGFQLLMQQGIKVGIITSENRNLNQRRADKIGLDFIFQNEKDKLERVNKLVEELGIKIENVAYIGDDINDLELLSNVGLAACPKNAVDEIKSIPGIISLVKSGGNGAFREFTSLILSRITTTSKI